jgi:SOS response regulatory protein OraA/RecX
MGVEALRSTGIDEIEARLKEKGYSEKAIKEIIRWYKS